MTNAEWIDHPGFYIKEEIEARGWSQRDLAFILGVPEQAVNMLVTGKRGISSEMARALGEAFDVPAEFFANLQLAFDMSRAKTPDPSVAVRRRMQTSFPVREMIKRQWIEHTDTAMLELQLSRFFEVEDLQSVDSIAHAAKKSGSYAEEASAAQLAWICRVRQIARSVAAQPYSERGLRAAVAEMETLLVAPESVRHVPAILARCGVRFVLVEKLPGGNIDGVCLWLNSTAPVIGLTTRFDRINNFWFVLRHEIEHVLRGDGKDEPIVDQLEGARASTSDSLPPEERAANAAAANFCTPTERLESFMKRKHPFYYEKDVVAFSRLAGRHPGLVVGQMQFLLDRYDYLVKYLVKVRQFVLPNAIADGWGQSINVPL